MRVWAALLACTCSCQELRVGVKAGIPVTQYFETGVRDNVEYSAATRRYTFGVSGEWRLRSFGVELDALYHRMGYVRILKDSAIDVKGNSWDFPLLGKYRFRGPYLAGGIVFRYVGPVRGRGEQTVGSVAMPPDTSQPYELRKRWYPGVSAAGGWELRFARFRVLPEFRYTRWTANISVAGGLLRFAPNQVEFVAGVLF